jgi:predicted MPP superfamily phosphohydrolase
MPTSRVLRFRDLGTKDTISEHCKLIGKYGYVWWGWWHKPPEKIPRNTFAQFSGVIESKGHLEIYLVDSGNELLYRATLNDIDISQTEKRKGCPEPNKTPSYYSTQEFKAWFRLTSIEQVSSERLRDWSYDEVTDFLYDPWSTVFQNKRVSSIQEMLNRTHRTIYFIQPYEKQHWDRPLEPQPPIKPANFMTEPIFSNSTYILHLSDLHFSTHHHEFSLKPDEIRKSFGTLLCNDLHQYKDVPPAAVIISGDLTWQGQPEEFDLAYDFIRMLQSTFDLDSYHFVIIPGNHDIQWGEQDEHEYDRTKPVARPKAEAEQNYKTFFKKCFGLPPTDFLSMGRRYVLGNYISVDIVGLNSSRLEQRPFAGYGYISTEQVQEAARDMGWQDMQHPTKYRMLVLHHHVIPVASIEKISNYDENYSLTLDAGQLIYEALKLKIDLVAHGHMYQPFVSSISRAAKNSNFLPSQTLTVHGAGSAGAKREDLGAIGKNSYSIYEFDEEGITIMMRARSEYKEGFEEDWQCRLSRNLNGGLKLEEK